MFDRDMFPARCFPLRLGASVKVKSGVLEGQFGVVVARDVHRTSIVVSVAGVNHLMRSCDVCEVVNG